MFNVTNIKSVLRVQQLCVSNKSLNLKGNPMLSPPDCLQIAWDKEIPGNFVSAGTQRSLVKVSANKRIIINLLTNISLKKT